MASPKTLLVLSVALFGVFTLLSLTVSLQLWQRVDFEVMVYLQDKVPQSYDRIFSTFSLLGSVEVTFTIAALFSLASLVRKNWKQFLGWFMIVPATAVEVLGKLFIFHPGPPVFFHRSIVEAQLPSFYVHTNFSYPSGHVTRTIFLATLFFILVMASRQGKTVKYIAGVTIFTLACLMVFTRVQLGEHWLSDVLGGVFLGASSGFLAAYLIIPKNSKL